jgi:hypothetical protein
VLIFVPTIKIKTMAIVIGRPINGISINGLEYLLDENGDYKQFESKEEAKTFLNSMFEEPLTDDQLEDSFMFMDTETDFENPEAFEND